VDMRELDEQHRQEVEREAEGVVLMGW
jgi:hypothetical protein